MRIDRTKVCYFGRGKEYLAVIDDDLPGWPYLIRVRGVITKDTVREVRQTQRPPLTLLER